MKVTFIEHSGFMVEMEQNVLLFDYYQEKSRHLTAVRLSMSLHHTAMPIIMISNLETKRTV